MNEGIISSEKFLFLFNDHHCCHVSHWKFLIKPYRSIWPVLHTMYLFSFCPYLHKISPLPRFCLSHQIRYICCYWQRLAQNPKPSRMCTQWVSSPALLVLLCVCVVCELVSCVHQRPEIWSLHQASSLSFHPFRQGFSLNLELNDSARLAG